MFEGSAAGTSALKGSAAGSVDMRNADLSRLIDVFGPCRVADNFVPTT